MAVVIEDAPYNAGYFVPGVRLDAKVAMYGSVMFAIVTMMGDDDTVSK